MDSIIIDESSFPIVHFVVRSAPSDDEFMTYLESYRSYFERGQPYAVVLQTMPGVPMTKSKHARIQADWMKTHAQVLRELCGGVAFVLPSPLSRGVLRAILSMQGMPCPFRVFDSAEPALKWARRAHRDLTPRVGDPGASGRKGL